MQSHVLDKMTPIHFANPVYSDLIKKKINVTVKNYYYIIEE